MKRQATLVLLAALLLGLPLAGCSRQESPPAPEPPTAQEEAQPAHASAVAKSVESLAGDGATIHYKVYGSGQPTLVFVHGWSCDARYWDAQLDAFAAQHTVVTVDLAGHGQSTRGSRKDWSMAEYGADVAAVVEAIGAPRVVLIGHSMGGPVILEAARRLPGKVIGLVGVDTFQDITRPTPKAELDEFLKPFAADFAAATRAFVDGNFFTEKSDTVIRQWIVEDMSQAPPDVAIPSIINLAQMDQRVAVRELDLPIVAINSDKFPTPEDEIRKVEPRFRVVLMSGVGHFVMMEDPRTFNALLHEIVSTWAGLDAQRLSP